MKIIRALVKSDFESMLKLLKGIPLFVQDELDVVLELADLYLNDTKNNDYLFFVTEESNKELSSFICFGPTPMTIGTYDLYWIGTKQGFEKKGLAKNLINFMIDYLKQNDGRLIRVETAGKDSYNGTQLFYEKINFNEEARIRDFYANGDDLIIFTYRVQ